MMCCVKYLTDYSGMRYLLKTGILVLLIKSVIGKAFPTEISLSNRSIKNKDVSENNCHCEQRYLKHYEAKRCQVIEVDLCNCPKKYLCPQSSGLKDEKVCIYQTEEYKLGSRINVTDKCLSCRCLGEEQPQIVCRHKECPQLDFVGDKNCHLVYEKDRCCPSKYECVTKPNENEAVEEALFCVYNGVTYPLGAKIYPSDDPCLICDCSENWKGVSNSSCHQQNCLFEKNKKLFDNGCVPIYHENKCCPIEYLCSEFHFKTNNHPLENDLIKENFGSHEICIFGGELYEIGTEISLKNPCITCNCSVPPDFTCVHQSCPPPPSIENCEVVVLTNYCCPSYKCLNENESVTNDTQTSCPTPICADETCEIKTLEGHQCPTCICDDSASHEKNIFEPNENFTLDEGQVKNESLHDTAEYERESLETEFVNSTEFISSNSSLSEKFVDTSMDKYNIESDENSEREFILNTDIHEKENETSEIFSKTSHEELDTERDFNVDSSSKRGGIKVLRKRSNDFTSTNQVYNQGQQQTGIQYNQFVQSQQHFFEEEEEPESDRERLEGSDEGFDELKISSTNKNSRENTDTRTAESLSSSESVIVPAGCPTPICANSSCKIKIPFGQRCPTCVCRNRDVWQP